LCLIFFLFLQPQAHCCIDLRDFIGHRVLARSKSNPQIYLPGTISNVLLATGGQGGGVTVTLDQPNIAGINAEPISLLYADVFANGEFAKSRNDTQFIDAALIIPVNR
jgi:hypothetical protein